MRKIIGIMILFLFAGFFLSREAAVAAREIDIGTGEAIILFLQGDVKVKKAAFDQWVEATEGMVLYTGDSLKTAADSWAEIGLGINYQNAVRIQENTLAELTDLCPTEINLLKGELRALVERLSKDETFEVRAPTAVCGVRGTGWDTTTDGIKVIVDVYENDVFFAAISQMEDPLIGAGKRGILEDPTRPIIIEDLPIDRMQDWKKWKEDFLKRRDAKDILKDKAGQGQLPLDNMLKGKQAIFEKSDQNIMDRRLDKTDSGGY